MIQVTFYHLFLELCKKQSGIITDINRLKVIKKCTLYFFNENLTQLVKLITGDGLRIFSPSVAVVWILFRPKICKSVNKFMKWSRLGIKFEGFD
ncbi:hypothetical protein SPM24T3_19475 [Serratia sp. M24T3]|nr:hypothetical protein SPM24T3_19475 [Serratia sp. M24T3]